MFNPGSGFLRCLEQRRVTNVAFAEPGFQVPPPLVFRVMVLAVKAHDDGRELAVRKDKISSLSWPSMSTRMGWNEMSRVMTFAFRLGRKVSAKGPDTQGNVAATPEPKKVQILNLAIP